MKRRLQLLQSVQPSTTNVVLYAKGHTNGLLFRSEGLGSFNGKFSVLLNSNQLGNTVIVNDMTLDELQSISNIEYGNVNYDFGALLSAGAATGSTLATYLGVSTLPKIDKIYEYAMISLGSIYFENNDNIQITIENNSEGVLQVYSYEDNADLGNVKKYTRVVQTSQTFDSVHKVYTFPKVQTQNPYAQTSDYMVKISDITGENTAYMSAWVDFTNASYRIENIPEVCAVLYDGDDTRLNVLNACDTTEAPVLIGVSRLSTAQMVSNSINTLVVNTKRTISSSGSNSMSRAVVANKAKLNNLKF